LILIFAKPTSQKSDVPQRSHHTTRVTRRLRNASQYF